MEWIKTSERLPETPSEICGGVRVWGFIQDPELNLKMDRELVYGSDNRFYLEGTECTHHVTHWQPLPERPKD